MKRRDNYITLNKKAGICHESNGEYNLSDKIYEDMDDISMMEESLNYKIYKKCGCRMVSD
tara:strand:+ start:1143 stop:1322 length:180 start_codon:yes stop_codon:yes gene_type:complete